jgi:hypothetical protein
VQVHQLVSTIQGQKRADLSTVDVIRATFPMGSMTGAPKRRSLALLDALEADARGIYSGAIGFFSLDGAVHFSVAIRTAVVTGEEAGSDAEGGWCGRGRGAVKGGGRAVVGGEEGGARGSDSCYIMVSLQAREGGRLAGRRRSGWPGPHHGGEGALTQRLCAQTRASKLAQAALSRCSRTPKMNGMR